MVTERSEPGSVLNEGEQGIPLSHWQLCDYKKGVGILLHMMWWSRPEILNSVRELSRHLKKATDKHYKAMLRVMKYCVGTKEDFLLSQKGNQMVKAQSS